MSTAGIPRFPFETVILWLDYWSVFNMNRGENHGVCLFSITNNYFISTFLQHIHSFGFVVCAEKQFLDKLILPICNEKINKIAQRRDSGTIFISFLHRSIIIIILRKLYDWILDGLH